jgi:hypothetical protein
MLAPGFLAEESGGNLNRTATSAVQHEGAARKLLSGGPHISIAEEVRKCLPERDAVVRLQTRAANAQQANEPRLPWMVLDPIGLSDRGSQYRSTGRKRTH